MAVWGGESRTPGGQRGQVRGEDAETPNVVIAKPLVHFRMRLSSMQLVQTGDPPQRALLSSDLL